MVQVRVAGVAIDPAGQHVILLKPLESLPGEGLMLPIWIGQQEATSILIAVEGAQAPRPLAHDLMRSLIEAVDGEILRVEISHLDEGTFFAEVTLRARGEEHLLDARPSDAVALASRVGAPIWVANEVMEEAGVPDSLTDAEAEIDAAERVDEFKRFLEDVDPDDFRE